MANVGSTTTKKLEKYYCFKNKFYLLTIRRMNQDRNALDDDDDDQLNVEHKIVPTMYNTTKTG